MIKTAISWAICIGFLAASAPAEEVLDPSLASPFQSHALETPFRESLPLAERQAGLALVWSEARYNFANFDLIPDVDWDALFLEFLPRVEASSSTADYYRTLQAFAARLRDGHSKVHPPPELRNRFFARPPLYTRLVQGRVLIYLVDSRRLRDAGISEGDEILAIAGSPVQEYAARNIRPYQSASTPQDLDVRAYVYGLLSGPADETVQLELKNASGEVREVEVARSGYGEEDKLHPRPQLFSWRWLEDEIALIDVRSFNDPRVLEDFRTAFPDLRKARGWIFDVRKNGGGNSGNGWGMLAHLSDRPIRANHWKTRIYRPVFRAWNREDAWAWYDGGNHEIEPTGGEIFSGPVMVLSSARTYSAAEDFLVAFRQTGRGLIIGQSSGGSTGQPLRVSLPGGGSFQVCSKRDSYADGEGFVGKGVDPDVHLEPSVEDFRANRDVVLERAVEEIHKRVAAEPG